MYVDYRFYEKAQHPALFPFGHGISYTTFALSNLSVVTNESTIEAKLSVTNTGARAGAETVQMYVSACTPSINRPVKELKGFTKVFLEQGEEKEVRIEVAKKLAASFWDEERQAWVVEKGTYKVIVGDSSCCEDFLEAPFEVEQTYWWEGL